MRWYQLSKSQLLIWTGQQLVPESPLYNMAFRFDFTQGIDEPKFLNAIKEVVTRHEILRSIYKLRNGHPMMAIRSIEEFREIESINLHEDDIQSWVDARARCTFDLEKSAFDSVLIKDNQGNYTWYVNQHHLITDGWSFALLYNEVLAIYLDQPVGEVESFSERKEINDERSEKYWEQLIVSLPEPKPYSKNEEESSSSVRIDYVLQPDTVSKINDLLAHPELRTWSKDLSLFNFFVTILAITGYKINGQRSRTIGVPALNRLTSKEKSMMGLFIEMFPVHASVGRGETYASLFKKYNSSANGFLKHAKPGLSTVAMQKTFNSVLNFINAKFKQFPGVQMKSTWIHPGASDPAHSVRVLVTNFQDDESLNLSFEFNEAAFNVMERTRFAEHFLVELERFCINKDAIVRPEEEAEYKLISEVNETDVDYPTDRTIIDLFYENLEYFSDEEAVKFKGQSLTFKGLDERSNQVAHRLIEGGIGPQTAIGIKMERSLEMLIGLLGIAKARGIYVPIDPTYPPDRISFMVKDAEIPLIIDESFVQETTTFPKTRLQDLPHHHDLFYIIYTSGSTGRPKGVMNEHGGVLNRLLWARDEFRLGTEDRILQKTNYTFDVSVGELFLPMLTGSTLVFAEPNGHRDSDYLKSVIDDEKITSIHFVPPMLELFLMNVKPGECESLRYISCTGEILTLENARNCKQKFPLATLYNLYGPTEAAVEVTMWKSGPEDAMPERVTIGKPFANVKIKIFDENEEQCGLLSPGELLIGGVQVARGYKNRPELTAQKFVEQDGLRWYKTGDLCQWLPNGEIEFFGRMDSQVKIRGFRVELEEIERVAEELKEVEDCVVVLHHKKIIAFVKGQREVDLQDYLASKLPDYMVPANVHFVDRIPYLNNGKIDRRRLLDGITHREAIHLPENEFQEFVSEIWSKTLHRENIDIKENFFSLGGDSLSGIRVITYINSELDLDLPVVSIFKNNTIQQLAEQIESEIDKRMMEA